MYLCPGLHGISFVSSPSLRAAVSKRRQLRRTRLLRLRGWLVWPQLYGSRLRADLRKRWKLHGAGSLHLPVRVVWWQRDRWGRRRLSRPRVRHGVLERRVVRGTRDMRLPTTVDRL